jgi:outer membrane protein TolC
VYRQTDYLTFLVTLQQQELAVRQNNLQFQSDYAMLNYLCGIEDTAAVELEEPDLTITALPQPENSVFFRQYAIDSLKLRNQRAVLDYSYKPKVSVFADAGYNSSLADLPYRNFGASVGFSVTVPLYDGKQRKMQYRKLDISEQTRADYLDFFSRQYRQQINQLLQQLNATGEMIARINNQVKYAGGLIQVNIKLLVSGDARIADLVIAINNYLASQNLLTQNAVSRLQIINQINYWNR